MKRSIWIYDYAVFRLMSVSLAESESKELVQEFRTAARNAILAGTSGCLPLFPSFNSEALPFSSVYAQEESFPWHKFRKCRFYETHSYFSFAFSTFWNGCYTGPRLVQYTEPVLYQHELMYLFCIASTHVLCSQ